MFLFYSDIWYKPIYNCVFIETIDELEEKRKNEPQESKEEKEDIEDDDAEKGSVKGSELSADEDVYEEDEEQPSKFAEVYSDTDSEAGEEEEGE